MEKRLSGLNSGQRRLIPLTSEIKIALMELKDTNTSSVNKSSNSLTELVRREVEAYFRSLDATIEKCIKTEELSHIISECIYDKLLASLTLSSNNTNNYSGNQKDDMEVTIQFVDTEANKEQLVLKENFSILEQRISKLESRISSIFQMTPRLKKISGEFKIDRKTLQQSIESHLVDAKANSDESAREEKEKRSSFKSLDYNPYDDMYYECRQNRLNRLHYKPSQYTLSLNKKLEVEDFHSTPVNNKLPLSKTASIPTKPFTAKFITSPEVLNE